MRILLFKRFESSVAAFRATITRLRNIHELFIQALDAGFIPAGEQAQSLLYDTDRDDQIDFADLEEALREASHEYHLEHFDGEALREALAADLSLFAHMERLVEPITPQLDDKLQVLREMLRRGRNPYENTALPGTLPSGKVLIFTQFSDTAQYLHDNLRDIVGDKEIRRVDSDTSDLLEVVGRFAPRANAYDLAPGSELRVLVTTDVLSEGLNLQDGDHVINYDLHWNPVRLIQRVGRVDRLGSLHAQVYVFNFLPEAGMERQLRLQERLAYRVQDIHDTIGEDAFILSPTERLNEEAMYAIYGGDSWVLDAAEEQVPFSLLEAEEIIRQLRQDDPGYFEYIKSLPGGIRSSRAGADAQGVYVLCEAQDRRGDARYRRLFLVDDSGEEITSEMPTILRYLQCESDEPRQTIPIGYNQLITDVQQKFDHEVRTRQSELQHSSSRGLGREYVLRQLRLIFEQTVEETTKQTAIYLSGIFTRVQLSRRCHNELNALRIRTVQDEELLEQLRRIVRDFGLEDLYRNMGEQDDVLITRVICSETMC
jgi:hypothetical protein